MENSIDRKLRRRERERGYRAADPEKYRERARKRYAANPSHKFALNRKYIAKKRDRAMRPTRAAPTTCECCGVRPEGAMCLDHCHETGKFRGWLCRSCNMAIGKLGDNSIRVARAVAYLIDAERETGLIPKL
jgi:recombination endonuclease VII